MTNDSVREKYGAVKGAELNGAPPIFPFSISVEGQESTGKTRFPLLTCPTPIVHVNYGDRDATVFLYDMPEERRKKVVLYSFSPASTEGWTVAEAKQSLVSLSEVAKTELAGNKLSGGTFVLDSGSSWWDAVQQVYVAPLEQAREAEGKKSMGGLLYGQGNMIVSGVVSWIKRQNVFFVMTHQKSQLWDSQGPVPGQYKARINSKVPYLVEVRLDLRKECVVCKPKVGEFECKQPNHMGRRHVARITKFGKQTAYEGMELVDDHISFAEIYELYTGKPFPEPERLK